jgi:Sulfotransferase domain
VTQPSPTQSIAINRHPGDGSHGRRLSRSREPVVAAYDRARWAQRCITAPLRLLPDYLIIGAQRAGTSALHRFLYRNAHVGKARWKEVHYFDLNYERGISWYRRHFPTVVTKAWAERRLGGRFVTGEATPYYLFHPLVPARVRETLPGVKLIAVLRDPVARAYSHYQHEYRGGNERLSFDEALARERERLGAEEHPGDAHRRFSYLARGVYVDQLERWFTLFPREQILVLKSEDLFKRPTRVVAAVCELIGVPPSPRVRPRRSRPQTYPPLDSSTRASLSEYYREHNERLYELLGRDFGWN